jgi:hypothetical protein
LFVLFCVFFFLTCQPLFLSASFFVVAAACRLVGEEAQKKKEKHRKAKDIASKPSFFVPFFFLLFLVGELLVVDCLPSLFRVLARWCRQTTHTHTW